MQTSIVVMLHNPVAHQDFPVENRIHSYVNYVKLHRLPHNPHNNVPTTTFDCLYDIHITKCCGKFTSHVMAKLPLLTHQSAVFSQKGWGSSVFAKYEMSLPVPLD